MKSYKYEEFTSVIEKQIRDGMYRPGQKLPSVRELKEKYSISMSTIQNGYEYLIIKGLVNSVPKSGYYVHADLNPIHKTTAQQISPVIRDPVFENHLKLITSKHTNKNPLSEFNVAAPGDLIIPQKLLLRTMQQVIRQQGVRLLKYYPPTGSAVLRSTISKRAASYGTIFHTEELIITDGALQALYIALASVCSAGDIIAIESPCIFSALEVIRMLKLKIVEIPLDLHSGIDLDHLNMICGQIQIKAILVTPNFQNPTGILLSIAQKRALVAIAEHHNIPLIENDVYGDLNFNGQRPCNLKSFDQSGLVMTYSSYAKTLAPGIRLGWLSPGKFFQQAEQIRFSIGSTVAPIFQETVGKLLGSGSYDRHLRSFRKVLAKNAAHTANLLSRYFPKDIAFLSPSGGYNIWVQLSAKTNMDHFYTTCENIQVRFTPGYTFSFSSDFDHCFRIVFADQYSAKKEERMILAGKAANGDSSVLVNL